MCTFGTEAVAGGSYSVTFRGLQMRTMSDETEQRMCDEDFGSDEEGEEGDVESYLEDNSSELMDRLRELEVRKQGRRSLTRGSHPPQ